MSGVDSILILTIAPSKTKAGVSVTHSLAALLQFLTFRIAYSSIHIYAKGGGSAGFSYREIKQGMIPEQEGDPVHSSHRFWKPRRMIDQRLDKILYSYVVTKSSEGQTLIHGRWLLILLQQIEGRGTGVL